MEQAILHPHIHMNPVAFLVAVVASVMIGLIWYGPMFGKAWAQEVGLPPDFKPAPNVFARAIMLQVLGALLTVWVLSMSEEIWRPSVWRLGSDGSTATYGFLAGFFTWLGFYVPQLLGSIAWENKSWKLFGINAAGMFIILQSQGLILAYLR